MCTKNKGKQDYGIIYLVEPSRGGNTRNESQSKLS